MTEPLLRVTDLQITVPAAEYHGQRRPVVSGIDFNIDAGQALGLVGESGSGKSMTARAVMRLFAPGVQATGTIMFDGVDIFSLNDEQLRQLRARRISMIFQDPRAHINPVRTVGAFLIEGLCASGMSAQAAERRVESLLADVGISDGARRMAQLPHELSGGQRQRVGIARALALTPDLLIADEPTSALDVSVQARFLELFQGLQEKLKFACLFISHDLAVIDVLSHRVAVMQDGFLVEEGLRDDILKNPKQQYTRRLTEAVPVPDPKEQAARRQSRLANKKIS